MKFYKKDLLDIIENFNKYHKISKEQILSDCIDNKLKKTIIKYNKELDLSTHFLLERHSIQIMKALTKIQKQKDKDALKRNIEEQNIEGQNE